MEAEQNPRLACLVHHLERTRQQTDFVVTLLEAVDESQYLTEYYVGGQV